MIAFYACLGVGTTLFVLLFFLGAGQAPDDGGAEPLDLAGERRTASCPPEIVQRVFSPQDSEYVARVGTPRLERFYLGERRRVALGWIRRTSTELSQVMRAHVRAARAKQDLNAATEARVFLQYLRLRCLCGLLLIAALVVRPSLLQELAIYASELSRQLASGEQGFERVARAVPTRVHSGT
jgi:hypothetical protein